MRTKRSGAAPLRLASRPTRIHASANHKRSGATASNESHREKPVWLPRVTVVVPALNEARNLPHVLTKLPDDLHEVILVDGRSTDDTVAVARKLRPVIRIVEQTRRGKGNALACGFAEASGDIIVMLDADGSHDPAEIPDFVNVLLDGADFAKGSRFLTGGGSSDITRFRRSGNRWLNRITNALCGTSYTDLCYGFNAFWRHCLPSLALEFEDGIEGGSGRMRWGDGFEIETLINIRIAREGLVVTEVPSFERLRLHGRSNLNAPIDGLRVLRTIAVEWGAHEQPAVPLPSVAQYRSTQPFDRFTPSVLPFARDARDIA